MVSVCWKVLEIYVSICGNNFQDLRETHLVMAGDQDINTPPPKWARNLLRWFLRKDLLEEVEGDLLEKYQALYRETPLRAKLNYINQVFHYFRPFAIRHFHFQSNLTIAMLSNYLKITLRNLIRQWRYASINIVGLSISLAVVFLMLLWVHNEWSTDRFHEKRDQLWRVKRLIPLEDNKLDVYRNVSYPMLEAAVNEVPEVKRYAMLPASFQDHVQIADQIFRARGAYANADFFEVFSFPVLMGDIRQLDEKVNAVAISEDLAHRFFGDLWPTQALGTTLHIHDNGDFSIEAIYENFPVNSSIQNEFVYSFQAYLAKNDWLLEWGNNGMQGVLELTPGVDPGLVGNKIQELFYAQQDGDLKEGCFLQRFHDDYLFSLFDDQARVSGGRIEYLRLFLAAAFLLLIISCINFVNLATARASKRALEVGVRKTIGATRKTLIWQFLTEAITISTFSIVIGLLLARLLLPSLELLTEKSLTIPYQQPGFWIILLLAALFTGLLAGSYPAFVLSSFRPIQVLKGKLVEKMHGISFRRVLVTIQFTLALLLIVSAIVIRSQVQYIQTKNLGLEKDHVLMIHQDAKVTDKYEVLRNELEARQEIVGVTVAGPNPLAISASTGGVTWPKKRPDQANVEIAILWSAHNFPEVFNIPMAAGRYYREEDFPDSTHIVLNEKAVEIMELGPDPIGQTIQWWGSPKQVIGVVKDFHNQSLYRDIQPVGFLLDPADAGNVFIRCEASKVEASVAAVEEIFSRILPEVPLHYEFLDDRYRQRYNSEVLTGKLADYFAIISIFISCLGLLGLITFVAEQKTRELGIRKILGAPLLSLVTLLAKDFFRLILWAFIFAIPVSYYLLNAWISKFQFQVQISWLLIFVIAGMGALLITGLTIGVKSLQAALASPIESIRSES